MKPTVKKSMLRSVEKQTKEKEKEKDFEVFLQGANQQRVQHKKFKESDKRLPPKEIKKWKQANQNEVEEKKNNEVQNEEEAEDSSLYQEVGSLDKNGLEQLRKSLYQPIFSQEQKDLLKRLSEEPSKFGQKFDPHFSQIYNNSDVYDDDLQSIDEEPTGHSNEEVELSLIDESITEELGSSILIQDEEIQQSKKSSPPRKSIQAQKVIPKPNPQDQIDQRRPRPISAAIQFSHQFVQEVNEKTTQQNSQQIKKFNTNPFGSNRTQSVLQNEVETPPLSFNEEKYQDSQQTSTSEDFLLRSTPLDNLLSRIQRMDDQQRIQLERMLDSLEQSLPTQQDKPVQQILEFKIQRNPSGQSIRSQTKTLNLIINSTWGSISMVGLTEIQLYDSKGEIIVLKPHNLKLRNTLSIKPIEILINDQYMTNNASNMWSASLPEPPLNIEIEIKYPHEAILAGLKIYNYNKSIRDSGKGVKTLTIVYKMGDEVIKLNKEIKRGTGNDMEDYGTEIPIIEQHNENKGGQFIHYDSLDRPISSSTGIRK